MWRVVKRALVSILIVFAVFVIFIYWDNNRIKIIEQDIVIENLPKQLEGFSILQITDLHEKKFGENQKKLIKAINSINYDVIVFTGDMLDNNESTNYVPFYSILENINNKENMLFMPGNADQPSYQISPTFGKSEFIKGVEKRGARLLESIDTVTAGEANIRFVNFELSIIKDPKSIGRINGVVQATHASNKKYLAYQKKLWEEMQTLDDLDESDVTIALNHYPVPDVRVDYIRNDPNTVWKDYDLIIAGHYHGGQIRLPFIGALYIPDPWYEPTSFFPPKDRVKGLWEFEKTKQYVSAGLGSSDAIAFLKFRLFNPPEINVLTFKGK